MHRADSTLTAAVARRGTHHHSWPDPTKSTRTAVGPALRHVGVRVLAPGPQGQRSAHAWAWTAEAPELAVRQWKVSLWSNRESPPWAPLRLRCFVETSRGRSAYPRESAIAMQWHYAEPRVRPRAKSQEDAPEEIAETTWYFSIHEGRRAAAADEPVYTGINRDWVSLLFVYERARLKRAHGCRNRPVRSAGDGGCRWQPWRYKCVVRSCCYVVLSKIIPSAAALANDWLIHELVVALFGKQTHCVELCVLEIAFDADHTSAVQRHLQLLGCFIEQQSFHLILIEHETESARRSLENCLAALEPNPKFASAES